MNNKRIYRHILQAAFVTSCLFVYSCENDPKEINALTEPRNLIEEARQVQSLLSENGRPHAFLKAPLMYRYNADTSFLEFPKTLHVDFYDSTGKIESRLDARYGKYFESRSKVYLRDSVVVANIKGDTLRSPDLWWDQNTLKFYTDKNVRVIQKDKKIYGKGLEADQDLKHFTIFHPTGILVVPDSVSGG
ncbi:MAG: LPS export ABC transporter periplasmic protein LptC [Candidatus Dadabacteria bacterium]